MCRWLAYRGSPLLLEELLFKPAHSLIDQSLRARFGEETANGDGFGIGWYSEHPLDLNPAVFRSISPAWSNRNLRELSAHVRSPLLLAHVRASTGTAVQQTNCHPFRHDRWLWMHNGSIRGFARVKRDLMLHVDPGLFACIEGSTDSEVMFYLALSLGLEGNPPAAVERTVHLIENVCHDHGIDDALQMTLATTQGERVWVFRYSSRQPSRTLYFSKDIVALRELYPGVEEFRAVSEETRLVVSEPFGDLPGAWTEVPEGTWAVMPGPDEVHPFVPQPMPA